MISIVLATYNESTNIRRMIEELLRAAPAQMEVIVVDDDSPDLTWQAAESLGRPEVRVVRRAGERGLASAFSRGIVEARGDFIGWMDADLGMPPSLLPALYRAVAEEGFDAAVGSRYAEGGRDDRSPVRVLSSRLINTLAGALLGRDFKDYTSGFALVKRSVLDAVPLAPGVYGEYFIEFIHRARRGGFAVREIGYHFRERTAGTSKTTSGGFGFLRKGLAYVLRIFQVRFRPDRRSPSRP